MQMHKKYVIRRLTINGSSGLLKIVNLEGFYEIYKN